MGGMKAVQVCASAVKRVWAGPALFLAGAAFVPAVVEQDGVRIAVEIDSHVYRWTVTNVDAPPIVGLELEVTNCYDEHAPDGWAVAIEGRRFSASATDESRAVRRGQAVAFSARVASVGAVLGPVPATLWTAPEGDAIVFAGVWGPVAMPRSQVALVAAVISAIVLVHWLVLGRQGRAAAARGP